MSTIPVLRSFVKCFIGDRLRTLEEENRRLSDNLSLCLDDISSVRNSIQIKPVRYDYSFVEPTWAEHRH